MNWSSIQSLLATAVLGSFIFSCEKVAAQSQECSSQWTRFSQKPGDEGAFPDTQVSYFRYTFKIEKTKEIRIKVSGSYPSGRYMGYNIYDPAKMDSVAGIADHEIKADGGFENPFVTGRWNALDRYTLWFDPQKQEISQTTDFDNSDPTAITPEGAREIWYRIYDPNDGPGSYGNVALPSIQIFDAKSGAPLNCPEPLSIPVPKAPQGIGQAINLPPGPNEKGEIHFVHHRGLGLYANRDTNYVSARLKMRGADEDIAVVRFKAPRSPRSFEDLTNPALFDVRYWSFCMGSALSTTTSACVSDKNAMIDEDGTVMIVIASRKPDHFPQKAHFIERPRGIIPIMIYRNLLPSPDYAGDMSKIPYWEGGWPGRNAEEFSSEKFIGPYAPVGRLCNLEAFHTSRCQIPN